MTVPELEARQLVKVPEAARILGLSRGMVYQLMDAGKLPYHIFGRARRIAAADLAEFIDESRRGGVAK